MSAQSKNFASAGAIANTTGTRNATTRVRAETNGRITRATRQQGGKQARTHASGRAGGRAGGRKGTGKQAAEHWRVGGRAGKHPGQQESRQADTSKDARMRSLPGCDSQIPLHRHTQARRPAHARSRPRIRVVCAGWGRLAGALLPARAEPGSKPAGAGAGGGAGRPPREVDGEKRRPAPLELALQPQQHLPPPHGSEVLPLSRAGACLWKSRAAP